MAFSFVDRIVELEEGKRIVTLKSVLPDEDYLRDHFPRFPVMPGVLMLECMFQASAWLLRISDDFAHSMIRLKEAKNVKYSGLVRPGDTMFVEAILESRSQAESNFRVSATRNNVPPTVVGAKLTLLQSNLVDQNATLGILDQQLRVHLRMQLDTLWHRGPLTSANST